MLFRSLVAITPACGALNPLGSLILGAIAGGLCALAVGLKYKFRYDDSLDVVGVHLVAGLWGTVGAGLLSTTTGLFYGGGIRQTLLQIVIALVTVVFSGVVTLVLGLILKATMGWRIDKDAETSGIDQDVHAESAYDLTASSGGRFGGAFADAGVTKSSTPAPPASITEGASA